MKHCALGVLLIIYLFLLAAPLASAATIEEATVNVYCRLKLGGRTYATTGSGVFIDSRGVILTNAHVGQRFLLATSSVKTKADCAIRTGSPAKKMYRASLLYLPAAWYPSYIAAVDEKTEGLGSGENDFALLYVTGLTKKKGELPELFPAIPLVTTQTVAALSDGTAVQLAGYPAVDLDYRGLVDKLEQLIADSRVESVRSFTRPHSDVLVLSPSQAGAPGVSGGPVVKDGGVLGIVTTVGDSEKGLRSARAISAAHIERVVLAETLAPLSSLLGGNYVLRAAQTQTLVPQNFRAKLESTLRRVR